MRGNPNPLMGPNQPKHYSGKKGRSGPKKGNQNSLRHGLKAGVLPKECKYIEIRMNDFRRQLEDAVLNAKGSVSISDAAAIQTAMRWERHAALAQRWLTKNYDDFKPAEILHFSNEVARASANRDKAVQQLGLARDQVHDAWAVLDVTFTNGDLEDK